MLLVSSLDVFDCCGLELGGECPHPGPSRDESGWRDSSVISLSLWGRPGSPAPPRNVAGQGTGANMTRFWEHRQTQPWPPSLCPETSGWKDRCEGAGMDKDAGSDQESGEPCNTAVLWVTPFTCCTGILLPARGPTWAIREPGQLWPTHRLLRCPGGHGKMSQWREERHWWKGPA